MADMLRHPWLERHLSDLLANAELTSMPFKAKGHLQVSYFYNYRYPDDSEQANPHELIAADVSDKFCTVHCNFTKEVEQWLWRKKSWRLTSIRGAILTHVTGQIRIEEDKPTNSLIVTLLVESFRTAGDAGGAVFGDPVRFNELPAVRKLLNDHRILRMMKPSVDSDLEIRSQASESSSDSEPEHSIVATQPITKQRKRRSGPAAQGKVTEDNIQGPPKRSQPERPEFSSSFAKRRRLHSGWGNFMGLTYYDCQVPASQKKLLESEQCWMPAGDYIIEPIKHRSRHPKAHSGLQDISRSLVAAVVPDDLLKNTTWSNSQMAMEDVDEDDNVSWPPSPQPEVREKTFQFSRAELAAISRQKVSHTPPPDSSSPSAASDEATETNPRDLQVSNEPLETASPKTFQLAQSHEVDRGRQSQDTSVESPAHAVERDAVLSSVEQPQVAMESTPDMAVNADVASTLRGGSDPTDSPVGLVHHESVPSPSTKIGDITSAIFIQHEPKESLQSSRHIEPGVIITPKSAGTMIMQPDAKDTQSGSANEVAARIKPISETSTIAFPEEDPDGPNHHVEVEPVARASPQVDAEGVSEPIVQVSIAKQPGPEVPPRSPGTDQKSIRTIPWLTSRSAKFRSSDSRRSNSISGAQGVLVSPYEIAARAKNIPRVVDDKKTRPWQRTSPYALMRQFSPTSTASTTGSARHTKAPYNFSSPIAPSSPTASTGQRPLSARPSSGHRMIPESAVAATHKTSGRATTGPDSWSQRHAKDSGSIQSSSAANRLVPESTPLRQADPRLTQSAGTQTDGSPRSSYHASQRSRHRRRVSKVLKFSLEKLHRSGMESSVQDMLKDHRATFLMLHRPPPQSLNGPGKSSSPKTVPPLSPLKRKAALLDSGSDSEVIRPIESLEPRAHSEGAVDSLPWHEDPATPLRRLLRTTFKLRGPLQDCDVLGWSPHMQALDNRKRNL